MHYIQVDGASAKKILKGGNKRLVCTINGDTRIHSALMGNAEKGYHIVLGAKTLKSLALRLGSIVEASFEVDESEFQFDMPEEMREVMETDPEAQGIFQNLTPGNQRSLISLVKQVKSTEKRIERALKIAMRLKSGVTSAREILR
jgi:hypothetical protein